MNWEAELELFREGVIERKVDLELERIFQQSQEKSMKQGAVYGASILGFLGLFASKELVLLLSLMGFLGLGISLSFLMGPPGLIFGVIVGIAGAMFSILGLGSLLSSAWIMAPVVGLLSCAVIGAIVGAGLHVKVQRFRLQFQRDKFAAPLREKHSMLILEPMELLSFWENRASLFILNRMEEIEGRLKLMRKNIQDSLKLEGRLKENEPSLLEELRSGRKLMENSIGDALQLKEGLAVLHSRFRDKVQELKILVDRQKDLERKFYLEEELQGQIRKTLKKGARLRERWEEDRTRLHSEIEGMALAFQEQLFQSKDFLLAHMQLEEGSQNTITNSD